MNAIRTLSFVTAISTILTLCAEAQTEVKHKTWWSLRSIVKPTPPKINGLTNPIDAFLSEKLASRGLNFSPQASKRDLIRRASFDLVGLPPSTDDLQIDYHAYIDTLLASPHYGERWGRYWLDIVRYGETDGGEHNYERPNAWPYRDYVIQAFNTDMPYDQFIREQLAADILYPSETKKLAATGFLVSGPWDQVSAVLNKDPIMRMTSRMDELDDMVTTTCATFLGLTVNCARCHDHKFDPIPSKDYYRMAAAFSGAGFGERTIATAEEKRIYDTKTGPLRNELAKIEAKIETLEGPVTSPLLLKKYIELDQKRISEKQRLPLNPLYNREAFSEVKARYWRMVILDQYKSPAHIDSLRLMPTNYSARPWTSNRSGNPTQPAILQIDMGEEKPVQEIVWSSDLRMAKKEGAPLIYRFEYSNDEKKWTPVASNLNHISRIELDLPELSDAEINSALATADSQLRSELLKKRSELQSKIAAVPAPRKLYAVNSRAIETVSLLKRGNVTTPIEPVSPGGLTCVQQISNEFEISRDKTDSSKRLSLANWITDPRNPLTARVIVNRVWYYHFGTGLVNTPSDFGVNGDRPSHPELLDWLASSFIEHGWSIKWLHRQIMTSKAYMQSSPISPAAQKMDAGNRLVWRMPMRRMDAETLRDSILFVSGSLDMKAGGPGFPLHQNSGRGSYIYHAMDNDGPAVWKRSVYRFVVRGGDKTILDSFDCPDPSVATPQRAASNTPVQALSLMNNQFVIRQSGILAARIQKEVPNSLESQIDRVFLLSLTRKPNRSEKEMALKFIKKYDLAQFCRAIFNSNEFIYTP